MKFSFGFLFVLLAVCSLFGGISANVCESENQRAASKACQLRCRAKDFEVGKCVEKTCECSQPRESK
uniref:Uncharacterized protein n=1 Tax=Anopheles stephensi TaxID=30069 RepID=A0A182YET5_ANOST